MKFYSLKGKLYACDLCEHIEKEGYRINELKTIFNKNIYSQKMINILDFHEEKPLRPYDFEDFTELLQKTIMGDVDIYNFIKNGEYEYYFLERDWCPYTGEDLNESNETYWIIDNRKMRLSKNGLKIMKKDIEYRPRKQEILKKLIPILKKVANKLDLMKWDKIGKFVINSYILNYGQNKFVTIQEKIVNSEKIARFLYSYKINKRPIEIKELIACLNSVAYFMFAKNITICIAAIIILSEWYAEVNRNQEILTDKQVKSKLIMILQELNYQFPNEFYKNIRLNITTFDDMDFEGIIEIIIEVYMDRYSENKYYDLSHKISNSPFTLLYLNNIIENHRTIDLEEIYKTVITFSIYYRIFNNWDKCLCALMMIYIWNKQVNSECRLLSDYELKLMISDILITYDFENMED
ncbi:MAG: hypothetical protein LBE91_18970 [Tannerella sp.]|jgi:hypothetical protein|nr:hypothetical protein [Tannerella sp.]